jgi:phage tail-like protein
MAVKFTRDVMKALNKTQGDFNQASHFGVEIDQVSVNGVTEVKDISHEHEAVEYGDGDDKITRVRPGRNKKKPITLKRDFAGNKEWFNWYKTVMDGQVARKSLSVIYYADDNQTESTRMNFYNCWPSNYTGPDLNSKSSAHAQESITLQWEDMEWK